MGMYKYLRKIFNKPEGDAIKIAKGRLIAFRRENVTVKISKPTKLHRARSLGYKAKEGYILVRQAVKKGGHSRPDIKGGRSTKKGRKFQIVAKSYRQVAEERANKKFKNLEVLNSYLVDDDGKTAWYEIIMVDVAHPAIKNDKKINWILNHQGRAFRGLTSAGKKSRGLRNKGSGAEKARPSNRAKGRKANN